MRDRERVRVLKRQIFEIAEKHKRAYEREVQHIIDELILITTRQPPRIIITTDNGNLITKPWSILDDEDGMVIGTTLPPKS